VKLKAFIKKHPDAVLKEIAEQFGCSAEAVRKALKRNHIILKKAPYDFEYNLHRFETFDDAISAYFQVE